MSDVTYTRPAVVVYRRAANRVIYVRAGTLIYRRTN